MDPLFWILAGVVVGCVIGIVVLWRLEARAEQRLAIQRQIADAESAKLKAIDHLLVIEETDTQPIPAPAQARQEQPAPAVEAPALPSPAPLNAASSSPPPDDTHDTIARMGTAPLPGIQVRSAPAEIPEAELPPNGSYPASEVSSLPEPAPPEAAQPAAPPVSPQANPDDQLVAASPDKWADAAAQPGITSANAQASQPIAAPLTPAQELLQTTPERARLRAAELARERQALEQIIEANQARLEELAISDAPGNAEAAMSAGLLRSEIAQQRERLLELGFLEQSYRQIADAATIPPAEPQPQAALPRSPRAFGVRRYPLARVKPPIQNLPAPDEQATESP